jgi:hypothetical protein
MATKKQTKKKQTTKQQTKKKPAKSTSSSAKKITRTKEHAEKKRTAKKLAKKNPALKKAAAKSKSAGKRRIGGRAGKKRSPAKNLPLDALAFSSEEPRSRSGEQSGDLQGLSNVEGADSESVDELLEEGNAFEAEIVTGVEDARNRDEREVRTHEVPEDDVPGEYLDEE